MRLEGELLLRQGDASAMQAMQCFNNAISLSNGHQQKALELRNHEPRPAAR
jgi:hypothetical protein